MACACCKTATHYNTLHHTVTHCNTLQHNWTQFNKLQHTATHCNTLQHTTTHRNTLQHATHCNILQHTATHHSERDQVGAMIQDCNTFPDLELLKSQLPPFLSPLPPLSLSVIFSLSVCVYHLQRTIERVMSHVRMSHVHTHVQDWC